MPRDASLRHLTDAERLAHVRAQERARSRQRRHATWQRRKAHSPLREYHEWLAKSYMQSLWPRRTPT